MKKESLLLVIVLFLFSVNVSFSQKKEEQSYLEIITQSLPDIYKKSSENLYFTVQIGAFKKSNKTLQSLTNVNVYKNEGELTRYRVGKFPSYKEAKEYKQIILSVCKDAFIVPIKSGERIHISEALTSNISI